jgi:hypothetical protein
LLKKTFYTERTCYSKFFSKTIHKIANICSKFFFFKELYLPVQKMWMDIMSLLNEFTSLDLPLEAKHVHTIVVEVWEHLVMGNIGPGPCTLDKVEATG